MSVESGYIDLTDMSGSEGKRSEEQTPSLSSSFVTCDEVMDKVRNFVREKGIMLEDMFHEYDLLRKGYVSTDDFRKVCKETFQELLSDDQVDEIQTHYCSNDSPNRCNWSKFLHDAESGFTAKSENNSAANYKDLEKEVLLRRVAQSLKSKRDVPSLLARASSQDVNRNEIDDDAFDAEQLLQLLGEISDQEDLKMIIDIYTDDMGFKYQEFVKDLKEVEKCHKKVRLPSKKNKVSPHLPTFSMEIPDYQTQSSPKPSSSGTKRSRSRFSISYEALVWIVYLVLTALCLVDRFVLSGDVVGGRERKLPKRLWGTNIGETITNVMWAVTGRIKITSQNLMFYTMMWCLPNFITEISPRWITVDGIRNVHARIHTFAGIFLVAIPSVAHVLFIFVPPLVDGTALKYYPPSTFNYSSFPSHLNWSTFWDPAAVQGWTFNDHTGVHLTLDEIYRVVLIIVLFCLIFPLSRSHYANQRSYSFAMTLHVFAGILYSVDNIRKIVHRLAHIFNLPVLIIWCVDRLFSIWFYRHHHGRIVRKEVIGSNEYVVLYLKLDNKVNFAVGDVYYLHHPVKKSTGILPQRSHPFTTFGNLSQDSTWDIGLVISIIEDEKQLCLPWTSWLASDEKTLTLHTWGPYRSSVWQLYHQLAEESEGMQRPSHYFLFATGSGCGYLLDVLSCLAHRPHPSFQRRSQTKKPIKIDMFFSVRCKAFYYFLRKPIDELLKKIKERNDATITFQFYVTSPEEEQDESDTADTQIQLINGRIDFEKVLKSANKKSCCYFVGRPAIAENVEKICKRKGVTLVKDYTTGRGKEQDCRFLIKCLKISFWAIFVIIAICVVAGLVIDVKSIKHSLQSHVLNATQ